MSAPRVAFTFDFQSLDTPEQITRDGQYESLGDCVRESLQIARVLQQQAAQGFSEVIVRMRGEA